MAMCLVSAVGFKGNQTCYAFLLFGVEAGVILVEFPLSHGPNGCKMYLLRSPAEIATRLVNITADWTCQNSWTMFTPAKWPQKNHQVSKIEMARKQVSENAEILECGSDISHIW